MRFKKGVGQVFFVISVSGGCCFTDTSRRFIKLEEAQDFLLSSSLTQPCRPPPPPPVITSTFHTPFFSLFSRYTWPVYASSLERGVEPIKGTHCTSMTFFFYFFGKNRNLIWFQGPVARDFRKSYSIRPRYLTFKHFRECSASNEIHSVYAQPVMKLVLRMLNVR
jgi:hypothetical protein